MCLGQAFRRIFRERCSDRRLPGTRGSDKHSVRYFDNGARVEGHRGALAYVSSSFLQCTIIADRAIALSRECARSQPSDERTPGIAPPHAVARVNLCVLWVGCQLSLLGGKRPIATTRCDRRRAIINSCASREALNPKFTRAACPHPTLPGGAATRGCAIPHCDNPGLKH